ncbi:post-PEP-CTERM-1 domain-containing protein [Massilia sp. TN1-12]|uniref:post-PEP-CTERM-1 domain-containing protein n=1 Tax=Massilia paldalensis TaxID=3377675 RepID=UPI00384D979F
MSTPHSLQRLLGAASILTLCASALPASAQQLAEPAPHSADSQTVARDATTGRLRAATPEEVQALAASKARATARFAAPRTLPKTHATGARGARLTDEFLTSSVAVRQPDGSLKIEHGTAETAQEAPAANTPVVE